MPALKNVRHERFAQSYSVSSNASDAWRKAGGKGSNANVLGSKWLAKVDIKNRIEELRSKADAKSERITLLSIQEKREFCARTLRLRPTELDLEKDGDLIQGIKYDKHGNKIYELMSAKDAICIDNDLAVDGAEAGANKALEIIIRKL